MILSERLKEIPSGYYIWHIDSEGWQEISSLTEDELQSDDSEWDFVLAELLLSDAHGQYIPNVFYHCFDFEKWHIKAEDYLALSDPDNENYWYAWEELMQNAYCICDDKKYILHQNGDLWVIYYMED